MGFMGLFKWSPERIENAYQDGLEHYNKKDYSAARGALLAAAERGHTEALYLLGEMDNHDSYYERAVEWYEKAAAKGHPKAGERLAYLYEFEMHAYEKAFYWYEKAAKQGDINSMYNVGTFYLEGKGTDKNAVLGFQWLEKAAELGDEMAQMECGKCCDKGLGTEQDARKALEWYEKAAGMSDAILSVKAESNFECGLRYFQGKIVPQDYEKALEFFSVAAKNLCYEANLYCGECCVALQDGDHALEWFIRAMEYKVEGSREAADRLMIRLDGDMKSPRWQFQLAQNYDAVRNDAKAFYWYLRAAEQGDATAQFNCGVFYNLGRGTPANKYKAFEWFEKAAKQGNAQAQYNCGFMCEHKEGTSYDMFEAFEWYLKAAEQGLGQAQIACAIFYYNGWGPVTPDGNSIEAEYWLEQAAKNSDEEAAKHARELLEKYF